MTGDKDKKNIDKEEAREEVDIEEIQAQCQEYLAGWQRAKADLANYRRDEGSRLEEAIKFASEDLIKDLVLVLDNFDLAIQAMEKSGNTDKGIQMIRSLLLDVLRKRGLEKIEIKIGDEFNPATAEAIAAIPSDEPENTIIEEVESGYRLHQKVIRPARVKVSKVKEN